MKERFLELFDYNRSMNEELIRILVRPELVGKEDLHALMSHILNIHGLWLARVEGKQPPYKPWSLHSPGDMDRIDREHAEWTQKIMDEEDIDRPISYRDEVGKTHYDRLPDILFHIVDHGTHHRAQLAMLMRRYGYEPPSLDYLVWSREG